MVVVYSGPDTDPDRRSDLECSTGITVLAIAAHYRRLVALTQSKLLLRPLSLCDYVTLMCPSGLHPQSLKSVLTHLTCRRSAKVNAAIQRPLSPSGHMLLVLHLTAAGYWN